MKLLAFDTSTQTMSIALQRDSDIFSVTAEGGSLASSRLIPEIQSLLQQAGLALTDLDGIAFGAGPGAFTGLRTSCAVAQGLGFAAKVMLCPVNTLHAVALQRHEQESTAIITAALDARMGEVYWQKYDFSKYPLGEPWRGSEPALSSADTAIDGQAFKLEVLPTAQSILRLGQWMILQQLAVAPSQAEPLYVRNKVALTSNDQQAARAVKAAELEQASAAAVKATSPKVASQ